MREETLLEHLLDIKERLSVIETQGAELRYHLQNHSEASIKTREEVDALQGDIREAKGSIKALRFVFGIPMVTMALLELAKSLLR